MFVRALQKEDWKSYKALRLESLERHADRYTGTLAQDSLRSDDDWRAMMCGATGQCFGLFDRDEMVGLAAIFKDREDGSGQSAFLASAYIREEYRGKGYSHLLYERRIQWAIDSRLFKRILVGHREGNEASRRANQAFGFEYTGYETKTFGDGREDVLHHYEMRLR